MFGRHIFRTTRTTTTTYRDAQSDQRLRSLREAEIARQRVERFRDEAAWRVR
jgi:hypothetical protein